MKLYIESWKKVESQKMKPVIFNMKLISIEIIFLIEN